MLLSRYLLLSALASVCWSQEYLQALSQLPACAISCSAEFVTSTGCEITNLTNCFCKSHELQYNVGVCVMDNCNRTEQYDATAITQQSICKGVPIPDRKWFIHRATIIISVITYPIVVLRFISRAMMTREFWWDDWTILAALIVMIPNTVIIVFTAENGFGRHFYNVLPQNVILLGKFYYVSQYVYVVLQNLPKFSILLLYIRIFPTPRFRIIVQVALAWMTIHFLVYFLAVALQCRPVAKVWEPQLPGKCVNLQNLLVSGAAFSIFEDLAILLLPVYELMNLNLSFRKRVALIIMFALGGFACVTSMVRLQYVVKFGRTLDNSWDSVDIVVWSMIEIYMAVICSCLMCIRPLILKYFPSIFPSTKKSAGTPSYPNSNPSWGRKHNIKLGEDDLSSSSTVRGPRTNNGIEVVREFDVELELKDVRQESNTRTKDGFSRMESIEGINQSKWSVV